MPPKTTTWQLKGHTLGKHKVLRNYMEAWLPKMLQYRRKVLFIDGFAGPGEYAHGEEGSPVIALDSYTNHSAFNRMCGQITFVFIEKESDRAEHLRGVIRPYKETLPVNNICIFNSPFVEKMKEILEHYESARLDFPPAFVMIDPFGVKDAPMHIIQRILTYPSTEVYISFMYEPFNRFRRHPVFGSHIDELFGCPDWRIGIGIPEEDARRKFLYEMYVGNLRAAGAKYVLSFDLYRNEKLIYTIFFATQRPEGCDVMKKAMWKTAPFRDYKFKSGTANQLTLGMEPTDFKPLSKTLQDEFGSMGWVTIERVEEFVMSDKTEFHTGHLKTQTLLPMEKVGDLRVIASSSKRSMGNYPQGTQLQFLKPWF